jgi:hypothetical protein
LAVANYESAHGHYPPAFVAGPDGRPWHSWRVLILPYIEYQDLHAEYRFDEPWDGPHNHRLLDRMPKLYRFHNRRDPGQTTTNYLAVVGPDTLWPGAEPRRPADVTDNLSSTVLIAENRGLDVPWMAPVDLELGRMSLEFNHPHGLSSWYVTPAMVTADGAVHTVGQDWYDPAVLRAMLTATGGERLTPGERGWRLLPDGRLRPDGP